MLEDDLLTASITARKRQGRFVLLLVSVAVCLGLFLLGVIRFDFTPFDNIPPNPADTRAPSIAAPGTGTDAVAEGQRREFQELLASFDATTRPQIEGAAFATWNPVAQQEILTARSQAVKAFGQSRYDQALADLEAAEMQAQTELAARESAFDDRIKAAMDALGADDPGAASVHSEAALALKPDDVLARDLKARSESLPAILSLLDQAEGARVANDLEKEAELLARLHEQDPTRVGVRLNDVREKLAQKRFGDHIVAGLAGVDAGDLTVAQNHLSQARAIFASRSETTLLAQRVAALELELQTQSLLTQASAATTDDDWAAALGLFEQAVAVAPNNAQAKEGQAQAQAMTRLHDGVAKHLLAPHRLGDEDVSLSVRTLLTQAEDYAALSPTLDQKAQRLSALLAAYAQPVAVRVRSDNETTISVRGVGQVGRTLERTIELKPGAYVFEGRRPGYRSKLVWVNIAPGAVAPTVEVICDERI